MFRTLLVMAILVSPTAYSQLVQSTFSASAESWQSLTLPYPEPGSPPTILGTYTPDWSPGYISLEDPDGSSPTGNTQYWSAPPKFLGNQSLAYGGTLSCYLRDDGSGHGTFHQEDVYLIGGGLTLVYDLTNPAPELMYTNVVVPLIEGTGWRHDNLAGAAATQADMLTALNSLTAIYIRAEYQLGPDLAYLSNVVITAGTTLQIVPSSGNVNLIFGTVTNQTYQLQSTTNLNSAWVNFGGPITGTGTLTNVLDTVNTSGSKFYRYKVN